MTYKQFKNALDELTKEMEEIASKATTPISYPIIDGPLKPEQYFESPIKIVWVLKEAYADGNEVDNESIPYSKLNDGYWTYHFLRGSYRTTWHPIVYTTYGILNNKLWNEKIMKILHFVYIILLF